MPEQQPTRGSKHQALEVFLGRWSAEGTSFGGTDQSGDPRANGEEWRSTHEARWHSGEFFLIQDERASIAGKPFDTLAILGVEPSGDYFLRSFENHGFYRDYDLARDGDAWQIEGETERATIRFDESGRRQEIHWEWKPEDRWLPLCDRVATRSD